VSGRKVLRRCTVPTSTGCSEPLLRGHDSHSHSPDSPASGLAMRRSSGEGPSSGDSAAGRSRGPGDTQTGTPTRSPAICGAAVEFVEVNNGGNGVGRSRWQPITWSDKQQPFRSLKSSPDPGPQESTEPKVGGSNPSGRAVGSALSAELEELAKDPRRPGGGRMMAPTLLTFGPSSVAVGI
jgi:hypothetical protein